MCVLCPVWLKIEGKSGSNIWFIFLFQAEGRIKKIEFSRFIWWGEDLKTSLYTFKRYGQKAADPSYTWLIFVLGINAVKKRYFFSWQTRKFHLGTSEAKNYMQLQASESSYNQLHQGAIKYIQLQPIIST